MKKSSIKFSVIMIFILCLIAAVMGTSHLLKERDKKMEKDTNKSILADTKTEEKADTERNTDQETDVEINAEKDTSGETEKKTNTEKETHIQIETDTKTQIKDNKNVPDKENFTENIISDKNITLSFVGDIYVSPMMYEHYQASGISGVISEKIQNIFKSVDIAAADHEYVCGDLPESYKVDYQQYTFLTPSAREGILKDFSFDVMTLANNHMMDYGTEGLASTIREIKKQGIETIGGGSDLSQAMAPYIKEVNGKKIAILAATRVVPQIDWYAQKDKAGLMTTYEQTDRFQMLKEEITRLKTEENCDIVIMYVHWGNDSDKTILGNQVTLGHGYIDAGADIVIGNHTHVLQGMEFYQGKLICYGISNFLFGSYHSDTMVLTLEIDEANHITPKMLPCSSEMFYTTEIEGEAAENMFRYIESMSENVSISSDGIITEKR
ncbi:CapA family protein [Lachnospiraceae bacterium 48-33]|jgi:Putative enzyme of poly-gamma-glutamate biosynthesis (capsule formation)